MTMNGKKRFKALDLFSGCGGVSCGLYQAGFDIAGAVEIDSDARDTYSSQNAFKKTKMFGDITKLNGDDLLKEAGIKKDELYLLAGCPPCQNFSYQNRKRKEKSREETEYLLFEFLRIIKETYPPFILMENVPGIRKSFNGEILRKFLMSLKNENEVDDKKQYYYTFGVLDASEYGVPQKRKRFVLHAVRRDIYEIMRKENIDFKLPEKTHGQGLLDLVTVWDAISDLPSLKSGESYSGEKAIFNHRSAKLSDINLQRITAIRKAGGSRSGLPDNLVLDCHRKYSGHTDVYGIMDPNKPAPTITGGCLSYSKGRFGHPFQDRAISLREAARLQTFPDNFVFKGSLTKGALQVRNAVPVKLVKASGDLFYSYIEKLSKNK